MSDEETNELAKAMGYKRAWVVEMRDFTPRLCEVLVVRESKYFYSLRVTDQIIGRQYFGERNAKNLLRIFFNKADAVNHLVKECLTSLETLEKKSAKLREVAEQYATDGHS